MAERLWRGVALEVEIVVGQLSLQATFFQQVIDSAAFAEIGLRRFHGYLSGFVGVSGHEVVIYIHLLFVSAHKKVAPDLDCHWRTL